MTPDERSGMDAERARELVREYEGDRVDRKYFAIDMAKGYLSAFNGPEVGALVEGYRLILRFGCCGCEPTAGMTSHGNQCPVWIAEEAIEKFRQDTGGSK